VTIGARIVALAGAGEVLVSSTVKDLVVGSALSFEDRGLQELRGVPDPWRIYAVEESA
jgi:class 3 adenylate cyclase